MGDGRGSTTDDDHGPSRPGVPAGRSAGGPGAGADEARGLWPPPDVVTRTLCLLFGAGAVLAVPAVVLDHPPGARERTVLVLLCASLVAAAVVLVRARLLKRVLGPVAVHGALVVSLVVVTAVVWCGNGDLTSVAAIGLFAWPPLFASAFLHRRCAAAYVVASAVLSVLVVTTTVRETQVSSAISAVGTVVVAAGTAGFLRALLLRRSATDPLTGLPGRHALTGLLGRAVSRAERYGSALTVAVVDLDDFKAVNDTGGHHAGDELLRQVARRWRRYLQPGHDVVRLGGDEFVVVLPGCDASASAAVVDALRRAGGHPCSIGLADRVPGEGVEALLARADAALYEAKRRGGDRAVRLPSEAAPASPAPRRWRPRLPAVPSPEGRSAAAFRAQLLGAFFAAGAAITLPGIVLDPVPGTSVPVAVASAVVTMAVGLALAWTARRAGGRFPMWAVHAGMVLSVVVLCGACLFAHGGAAGIVSLGMVTWATMYVTALFSCRLAVAYCTFGLVAVALTVSAVVRGNPVGVALLCLGAAAGAGALVGYLALLLQRQAGVDALTGLPNRGALRGILERELSVVARSGVPLCLALVDLDHLKVVNDTDGHAAGDRLLVDFAQTWPARLRSIDTLVRYGGDEFVLVLPGCDLAAATDTLARLRHVRTWSCSVGLTEWSPGEPPDALLARADAAVYEAKAAGRGRVVAVAPSAAEASEGADCPGREGRAKPSQAGMAG